MKTNKACNITTKLLRSNTDTDGTNTMKQPNSRISSLLKLAALGAVVTGGIVASGCSGDVPRSGGTGESYSWVRGEVWKGPTEYGIRVQLQSSGTYFTIPPLGIAGPPADLEKESDTEWVPDWATDLAETFTGTRSKEQNLEIEDPEDHVIPGSATSVWMDPHWVLAWGAAVECEYVDFADYPKGVGQGGYPPGFGKEWFIADYPWQYRAAGHGSGSGYAITNHGDRAWYFLAGKAGDDPYDRGSGSFWDCEELLRAQMLTECIAKKLDEVASTLKPITWQGPGLAAFNAYTTGGLQDVSNVPNELKDTWVIPPQQPKSRFIARDAAINALAHLAQAEFEDPLHGVSRTGLLNDLSLQYYGLPHGEVHQGSTAAQTCADGWLEIISGDLTGQPQLLFGEKWFAAGISDDKALARHYLKMRNEVLEGAGILLKRQIDETIEADMAQAAASGTSDSKAYWGVDDKRSIWTRPGLMKLRYENRVCA